MFSFAVPTAAHTKYQWSKALPYFIKRWVFFNRSAVLEPLYDFSEVDSHKTSKSDRAAAEYHNTTANKRDL